MRAALVCPTAEPPGPVPPLAESTLDVASGDAPLSRWTLTPFFPPFPLAPASASPPPAPPPAPAPAPAPAPVACGADTALWTRACVCCGVVGADTRLALLDALPAGGTAGGCRGSGCSAWPLLTRRLTHTVHSTTSRSPADASQRSTRSLSARAGSRDGTTITARSAESRGLTPRAASASRARSTVARTASMSAVVLPDAGGACSAMWRPLIACCMA